MKIFKSFFLFGFFGIILLCLIAFAHEQVHIQIYKEYGIPSHIEYFSHFPDLVTVTDNPISDKECPDSCKLAHNLNEAISYPLIIAVTIIYLGLFVIVGELTRLNDYFERLLKDG